MKQELLNLIWALYTDLGRLIAKFDPSATITTTHTYKEIRKEGNRNG